MQVQYRIAVRGDKYYPHVRIKKRWFWSEWKYIGEHLYGEYGTYDLPEWSRPRTEKECKDVIKGFHKWLETDKGVSYIHYNPKTEIMEFIQFLDWLNIACYGDPKKDSDDKDVPCWVRIIGDINKGNTEFENMTSQEVYEYWLRHEKQ